MRRIVFVFLAVMVAMVVKAQITTSPDLPVSNQPVTVSFNSADDDRLNFFTGDLYAHTGVLIEGKTNWQHVIGTWGQNNIQPKLTHLGNGIYELNINPDINRFYGISENEVIQKMAFVFRSSDGSKQTNDLFVDVYQPGLSVRISSPENNNIIHVSDEKTIEASSTDAANLSVFVNGNLLKETNGTIISSLYTFAETGTYEIVARAQTTQETASDTIYVVVRDDETQIPLPHGSRKGISYPDDESVRLVLWAPDKQYVYLLSELSNWKPDNDYQLTKYGDYFWIEIDGLESGKEYPFQYLIDGELTIADPYTEKILDPGNDPYITNEIYPGLISYPEGKLEGIASVFQPGKEEYQWEYPSIELPEKEEMVIYEMLIRDFTEEHTYASVIEKLDYLENLNINVLELMPVNEFEGNQSWGYNPSFYFAPDKYYGPATQLKRLIDECHKRGIAVVIDMVLNHSFNSCTFARMYWENDKIAADNPWYNVNSNFSNPDAQWGSDFNHESEATKELVDSVNSFWMNEYKVDGFRFDFTKGFSNTPYGSSSWGSNYDQSRINNLKRMADEIWKRKPGALVILEHLADNSEEKELAKSGMMLWGNLNHNYAEAAMGYTQSNNSDVSWGYYASRGWSEANLVTYQESHDEERIAYKTLQWGNASGTYNIKNLDTTLDRLKLNAVFHLPIPGPKMIWQFGELGYDYSIDYNGRLGEKPIKWNYVDKANRVELFKTVAALNHIKQSYDEFSSDEMDYSLKGAVKTYRLSDGDNHVVAIGNFDVAEQTVSVNFPKTGSWHNYFTRERFNVSASTMEITLQAGEYLLLTSREMEYPEFTIRLNSDEIKINKNAFEIYPNPVNDYLFLTGNKLQKAIIRNINGQKLQGVLFYGDNKGTIYTGSLKSGVYFISIESGSGSVIQRFIKR
ncbi:MAG: T9SS type A sorting domain-containing protein [Prolixibacteraceae bacterium]|nr:T9SS type A sorting domain-containing protein [Prolixibacteraceae bacterium]MBN2648777.1 T9SS type A sorting domain-containing protein [Prolixibacteraceae bacterium]